MPFTVTGNLGALLGSTATRTVFIEASKVISDTGGNVVFAEPDDALVEGGLLSIQLPSVDLTAWFTLTIGKAVWNFQARADSVVLDLSDVPVAAGSPLPPDVAGVLSARVTALEAGGSSDSTALTRLERQAAATLRENGARATARAADAALFTEAWANLTAWPGQVTPTVGSGRVFGTSSSFGVQKALNLAPGQRFVARAEVLYASGGKNALFGFNNDAAGGAFTGGTPNAVAIGVSTTGTVQFFKGGNVSGAFDGGAAVALTSGQKYILTAIVDDTHITFHIQPAGGGALLTIVKIPRANMPGVSGNGTLLNLFISGSATAATETTIGPVSTVAELTTPVAAANRVVAGTTLFGTGLPLMLLRNDPATAIRHIVQLPSTYDARVPSPLVIYMHGASEHGLTPWLSAKGLSVINALEAAGYIVASSDNGTSTAGGGAGFDDKFGNQAGCDDYAALAKYARRILNTSATFLWGVSMGGEFVENTLAQRAVGGIAAVASICPGLDLVAIETNPTYQAGIWTAYGAANHADFLIKIAGKNPIDLAASALRSIPQRFYVASDDALAPPATHAQPLVDRLTPLVPECQVITTTGGHVATSTYQGANMLAFFETYR